MEALIRKRGLTEGSNMPEMFFSFLDKGIDDMEAGRVHTVDEAFRMIRDRARDEL